MEIMGLAIIVILITLGVLFALTTLQQEDSTIESEFEQKNLASGFLHTFLGVSTPCAQSTIQDLFFDCARQGGIVCAPEDDPWKKGRALNACRYVNETASYILNQTLAQRKTRYYFSAKGPQMEGIRSGSPCTGERVLATQPFNTRVGQITIELQICG